MAWKKGDPNHPRRGNGAGKGEGWGGPAKGASTSRYVEGETQPMQGKSRTSEVVRSREERLAALKDKIFDLASSAEREETQLAAAIAYLNREEGLPIARQLTATTDENRLLRIEIVDATGDADSSSAAIPAADSD
jgi:hypothetical protein